MQGQRHTDSIELNNLYSKKTKVKTTITRLYEIELAERAECQARNKAREEQYSCMDSEQLPRDIIGA